MTMELVVLKDSATDWIASSDMVRKIKSKFSEEKEAMLLTSFSVGFLEKMLT